VAAGCVLTVVASVLAACGEDELRAEIAAEMEAATEGTVLDFELADNHGNRNLVKLGLPEGETAASPADIAAVIAVVDSRQSDGRLAPSGVLRLTAITGFLLDGPHVQAEWRESATGGGQVIYEIRGELAYGSWMCQLPTLRRLYQVGRSSDFSQAGECSPELEILSIASWDESTGHDGLADLNNLKHLGIDADLTDVRTLPEMRHLETLGLPNEANTPENRAYLEDRYPGCDVDFAGPAPPLEPNQ
jgi:hypothetical protein